MDKQTTFEWNTACRIAETLDGIKPEDISVEVAMVDGVMEPTISYFDQEAGYTFRGVWRDGESINDIQWDYA